MSTSKNYNYLQARRVMKRPIGYTHFLGVGSIAGVPVKRFFMPGRF
jgi:hypothetical protein